MQLNRLPIFWIALAAAGICVAIYSLWPSYMYAPDSLQAAMAIQSDAAGMFFYHPAGGTVFEPGQVDQISPTYSQTINMRYFLDYPTSVLVYRLWNALGYEGLVVTPVLALRALAGGLGVFFVVLTLFELTGQRLMALVVGLGMGVSASYWTFATDMYQTINMAALVSVALYLLVRQSRREAGGLRLVDKGVVGLALGLAALYNILAVLTMLAFGVGVALLHGRAQWTDRFRHLVVFGVICIVLFGALYVLSDSIIQPTTGQRNPFTWTDEDSGISQQVFTFEPVQNVFRVFVGFTKSHAIFPGVSVRNFGGFRAFWDASSTLEKGLALGFYGVIALAAAVPVGVLMWKRRALAANQHWLLVMLPVWLLIYVIFNWLLRPSDVHYWIVPMLIWWTAVGLCLNVVRIDLSRYYRLALVLVGGYVVFTFGINLFSQFLPESQPENNPWLAVAEALGESEANALFLSSGHPLDFHVAYFSRRNVLSTDLVDMTTNALAERSSLIVNSQVEAHRRDAGEVYLYSQEAVGELAGLIGLTADDLEVAWEFPQLTIYRAVFPEDTA